MASDSPSRCRRRLIRATCSRIGPRTAKRCPISPRGICLCRARRDMWRITIRCPKALWQSERPYRPMPCSRATATTITPSASRSTRPLRSARQASSAASPSSTRVTKRRATSRYTWSTQRSRYIAETRIGLSPPRSNRCSAARSSWPRAAGQRSC